jgi:hypothetical protein
VTAPRLAVATASILNPRPNLTPQPLFQFPPSLPPSLDLTSLSADGSRSSNHSSGTWTPDDLQAPTPAAAPAPGEASPLAAAAAITVPAAAAAGEGSSGLVEGRRAGAVSIDSLLG